MEVAIGEAMRKAVLEAIWEDCSRSHLVRLFGKPWGRMFEKPWGRP